MNVRVSQGVSITSHTSGTIVPTFAVDTVEDLDIKVSELHSLTLSSKENLLISSILHNSITPLNTVLGVIVGTVKRVLHTKNMSHFVSDNILENFVSSVLILPVTADITNTSKLAVLLFLPDGVTENAGGIGEFLGIPIADNKVSLLLLLNTQKLNVVNLPVELFEEFNNRVLLLFDRIAVVVFLTNTLQQVFFNMPSITTPSSAILRALSTQGATRIWSTIAASVSNIRCPFSLLLYHSTARAAVKRFWPFLIKL